MLPPFIIEQLRRREQQEQSQREQPRIELEIPRDSGRRLERDELDSERGVVEIDLFG